MLEQEGKSKGTCREYFANISHMENYFNKKDFRKITTLEMAQYVDYLSNKYNKNTYNNHVAAIRYLYKKVIKKKRILEVLNLKRIRELDNDAERNNLCK